MSKYEEILKSYGIFYTNGGGVLATKCPFCKNAGPYNDISYFGIDSKTGIGYCGLCGKDNVSFDEFLIASGVELNKMTNKIQGDIKREETKHHMNYGYHLWSIGEIYQHEFGKQEWVIEKLIPIETVTILSGNPQSFKTWLTTEMAKCVALGISFLGEFPTAQGTVLIVNEEDNIRYMKKRLSLLGVPDNAPILYLSQAGVKIDKHEWIEELIKIIRDNSVKLVILDSFIRIHSLQENDSGDMAYVFERIRILVKAGTTILITHHHRKENVYGPKNASQSIRGSSDIPAAVDCHLSIERDGDELTITQNKLRVDESLKPFKVFIDHAEDDHVGFSYQGDVPDREAKKDKLKTIILDILKDGEQGRDEIEIKVLSSLQVGKNMIGSVLKDIEQEGLISVRLAERNKKFYSIRS